MQWLQQTITINVKWCIAAKWVDNTGNSSKADEQMVICITDVSYLSQSRRVDDGVCLPEVTPPQHPIAVKMVCHLCHSLRGVKSSNASHKICVLYL